jgi:hypothetical protein
MAGGGGSGGTPLAGPGSSLLEAWYRWNLQQEFGALLYTPDAFAPAVSVTWPTFTGAALQLRVKAGGTGTRSTCVLEWRGDSGAWNTIGPGLGATVALGGSVVLNLPTGTYTDGQTWFAIHTALRDNKNSHHFLSQDPTPGAKNPRPKVTPYGTFLSFDGVDHMLRCVTSLAPTVAGGIAKAFYVCMVVYVDSVSPSSGFGTLLWFGTGLNNNHALFMGTAAAGPAWQFSGQDDSGGTLARTGGTPATGTPYVVGFLRSATTVTVRVNGTTVISAAAFAPGTNTWASLALATIGKSYNSLAEGNPLAYSLGEMLIYNAPPTAGEQTLIESRVRAGTGF